VLTIYQLNGLQSRWGHWMIIKNSQLQAGPEKIAITTLSASKDTPPSLLSLHGGGPAGKEKIHYLTSHLTKHGFSSVCFDFSGHGKSSGRIKNSSLRKRVFEALQVYRHTGLISPITLIGSSMGGSIALELLPLIPVYNLILFCPALYAGEAFNIPFGSGFTEIIRKKNSYERADVLENLKTFKGNILLFTAEYDKIIPERVIDLYWNNTDNVSKKMHVNLKETPHAVHSWAERDQNIKNQILKHVTDFLIT